MESKVLPCDGKLIFETKEEAEGSAVAIDWERGIKLKAYLCRHCNLWHLSSV